MAKPLPIFRIMSSIARPPIPRLSPAALRLLVDSDPTPHLILDVRAPADESPFPLALTESTGYRRVPIQGKDETALLALLSAEFPATDDAKKDPRRTHLVVVAAAHGAAVLAADCGRDLLATAGAVVVRGGGGVGRGGETLAADPVVRVFDVRSSAPRPLSSLHFAPRAIDLKFHPHLYGTLLLASANGVVALADVTSSTGGGEEERVFFSCLFCLFFFLHFFLSLTSLSLSHAQQKKKKKKKKKHSNHSSIHLKTTTPHSCSRRGPRRALDAHRHRRRPAHLL